MSLRNMLSAANPEENSEGNESQQHQQTPVSTKAKRGRKKATNDSAIEKSEGHRMANTQRQEAAELVTGLERQEQILTAAKGFQDGQNLAKILLAAKTAGASEVLVEATLDRIGALKNSLQDGLQNHDPLDVLDGLGLLRNGTETNDLRAKIAELDQDDVSRFLL